MSSKRSNVYIRKISKQGQKILCPIDDARDSKTIVKEETEDCVEQDVVGRYAANIEIE